MIIFGSLDSHTIKVGALALVARHAAPLALVFLLAAAGPSLNCAVSPLATLLLLPTLLMYLRGLGPGPVPPLLLQHSRAGCHWHTRPGSPGHSASLLVRNALLAWAALSLGHFCGYAGAFQTPNDQGLLVNSLHPVARLLLGVFAALPYIAALLADHFTSTGLTVRRGTGVPARWITNRMPLRLLALLATRYSWLAFPATLTTANFLITRYLSPFGTWGTLTDGIPTSDVSTAVLNLLGLHGLVFLSALFSTLIVSALSHNSLGAHAHESAGALDGGYLDASHSASPYTLAATNDLLVSSQPMSYLDLHAHAGHASASTPPPLGRLVSRRISSSMFAESGMPSVPATPVRPATAATCISSANGTTGSHFGSRLSRPESANVPMYFVPAMRRLFGIQQVPTETVSPAVVEPGVIPRPDTRSQTPETCATSATPTAPMTAWPAPACPRPFSPLSLSTILARLLLALVLLATYTSLVIRHPNSPFGPAASSFSSASPSPLADQARHLHLGCIVDHQAPAHALWKSTQVLANVASSARNASGTLGGPRIILWSEEATRVASAYERNALIEHAGKLAKAHGVWLALAYWEPAGLPRLVPADEQGQGKEEGAGGSKWLGKNKLTVVSAGGQVVVDYVKVHPVLDVEGDIQPGRARAPPLVDVDGVKVALAICLDGDFDGWVQQVARSADVLLMPSWTWGALGPTHRLHAQQVAAAMGLTVIRCPSWGLMSVDLPTGDAVYAQRMEGVGMSPMVPVPVVKITTLNALVPDWIAWACVAWCVMQLVAAPFVQQASRSLMLGESFGRWQPSRENIEADQAVGEEAPLLRHVAVMDHQHAAVARHDGAGQPLQYPPDFFASWGDDAGSTGEVAGAGPGHHPQGRPARSP